MKSDNSRTQPVELKRIIKKSGAGGSRTRVQTRKQYGFYMLSPDLVFVHWLDQDHRPMPYLLNFA